MLEKLLTAFFSISYASKDEMKIAFEVCNKKWTRYARKTKLNEKEFEEKSKQVLTKTLQDAKSLQQ